MFPTIPLKNFQIETCRLMAQASAAAYGTPEGIRAKVMAAGGIQFYPLFDKATDTNGFVAANETDVLLNYCGTKSPKNWLMDSKFLRRPWTSAGGKVFSIHDGFADVTEAIWPETLAAVRDLASGGKRIWAGGHSLGASVASTTAVNLVESGLKLHGVYTFGKPRVGTKEYRDYYNSILGEITFRLENGADIVTKAPGALIGYRHEGRDLFMDEFGGVQVDPFWALKLPSDVWGMATELSRGKYLAACETLVDHHFMAAYLKRLEIKEAA